MSFTPRNHKHVQRFNETELKLLDEEVARLRARTGKKITRARLVRIALDVYFSNDVAARDAFAIPEPIAEGRR